MEVAYFPIDVREGLLCSKRRSCERRRSNHRLAIAGRQSSMTVVPSGNRLAIVFGVDCPLIDDVLFK